MGKIKILSLCIFDTVINRVKYLIEKSKRQLFVKRTLQMVEEREEQRLDHRQPWDRSIHQNGLQVLRNGLWDATQTTPATTRGQSSDCLVMKNNERNGSSF